jgi:EAL domain-containing protein (putative c-di-GMP-specific phosphodiesterase class I)
MASLAHLPVQAVKLDRSFVGDLEPDTRTRVVARGIVGLAHRLNVDVGAEGVESAGEVEQLMALGCTLAQGYYFAPPVEAADVPDVLARVEDRLRGGGDADQTTSA